MAQTENRKGFGRIWRMVVVLLLLLCGGMCLLQGCLLLVIAPEWEPPPDLPSWRVAIGIYIATGFILLSLGFFFSRRWKQYFWTRFSLSSILAGTAALCFVMAMMARPAEILKRELVSVHEKSRGGEDYVNYTVRYDFRSPGWPVIQPTIGFEFSDIMPQFGWDESDRRAQVMLRQCYYGTDEYYGTDILRCLVIVLGSMYGTELLLHWLRRSRGQTSVNTK